MPASCGIRTQVSSMTCMLHRPERYHLHNRGGCDAISIPRAPHNFTHNYIHSQLSSFSYSSKLTHQSTQLLVQIYTDKSLSLQPWIYKTSLMMASDKYGNYRMFCTIFILILHCGPNVLYCSGHRCCCLCSMFTATKWPAQVQRAPLLLTVWRVYCDTMLQLL